MRREEAFTNDTRLSMELGYLTRATWRQMVISFYIFFDFILPDFTILTPVRKIIGKLFWTIGKQTRIRKGMYVARPGNLVIGRNCFINRKNLFDNASLITIGDNCAIGFDNKFLTVNHIEKDKLREENQNTFYSQKITIGNGVWISSNCIILPGTEIGDNVIISAGSIVKGKIEGGWIYEGNPAQKVRETLGFISKKL
jgi:acetyltransferase-like isoleucine patch superfamily enzyme